jgi:hypothetical protein
MPIFFFNVRDQATLLQDKEGSDLVDLNAALTEARESAREIAADCLRAKVPIDGRKIEIMNSDGVLIGSVTVRDVVDG